MEDPLTMFKDKEIHPWDICSSFILRIIADIAVHWSSRIQWVKITEFWERQDTTMITYSNPWVCIRANCDVCWLHRICATSQRCLEGRRAESARGSWERWTWTSEMWSGVLDPSSGRAVFASVRPGWSHRLRWVPHSVWCSATAALISQYRFLFCF